jgi:hypothetical protein
MFFLPLFFHDVLKASPLYSTYYPLFAITLVLGFTLMTSDLQNAILVVFDFPSRARSQP